MEEEEEAVEEEEEEEANEEEQAEAEQEEEEEEEDEEDEEAAATVAKDPEEYEYSIDSGPYQASDYLDNFYYEKSGKYPTQQPLTRGDSCE